MLRIRTNPVCIYSIYKLHTFYNREAVVVLPAISCLRLCYLVTGCSMVRRKHVIRTFQSMKKLTFLHKLKYFSTIWQGQHGKARVVTEWMCIIDIFNGFHVESLPIITLSLSSFLCDSELPILYACIITCWPLTPQTPLKWSVI